MKYVLLIGICLTAGISLATTPAESSKVFNVTRTTIELYTRHCASCHGKDGRAKTTKSRLRYHARDLTNATWQEKVTDERIFNSIMNGKGKMPSYAKKLSEREVESLVIYVRAFRG
jgi:mono/diheme cytochrome c family protein